MTEKLNDDYLRGWVDGKKEIKVMMKEKFKEIIDRNLCDDKDFEEDCLLCKKKRELKQEAIKWIKEDLELIRKNPLLSIEKTIIFRMSNRWKKRFNITDEELGE